MEETKEGSSKKTEKRKKDSQEKKADEEGSCDNDSKRTKVQPVALEKRPPDGSTGCSPEKKKLRFESDDEDSSQKKPPIEKVRTLASFDMLTSPSATSLASSLEDPPTSSSKASLASTDVAGQCKPGSGGASRMTKLTEEQKGDISNMASPACMEAAERKRQYAAMGRAIVKSCNPSLLAKYQLCSDTERWTMLKQWMVNDGACDAITVEERYVKWTEDLRSDRYTTVTLLQLEQRYGSSPDAKEFIDELIKGQAGTPHPQAPSCKKARMYKVLKEISEEVIHGQRADSSLSVGGRVRNPEMKSMLAKQLGQGLQSLEGATLVDTKTGRIASKKVQKEKTKEQLAVDELKKMKTKLKKAIKDLPEILDALGKYGIRNSNELELALKCHQRHLDDVMERVDQRLGIALSDVDAGGTYEFIDHIKKIFGPADTDIRDAKRRISVAKGPKKKKDSAPVAEIQDGNDDGNGNESSVDSSDGEDDQ